MEVIFNEVLKAFGILLGAGLIFLAYSLAKQFTKDSDKGWYSSLLIGLAVCAVLGFFNAGNVGKPTCLESDTDNRGSVCLQYDDDGYEPSTEERVSVFAFWFVVTIIPISLGVRAGFNARKNLEQISHKH